MGKRIQFDDDAREALRRGVDQLAGVVRVTLGPRGRNVVIEHGAGSPTITNDGLAIAREIELADRFENMGAQLVKEVALKTGEVAGDGTTTATVLAHAIVTRGLQAIAAGHGPMQIRRGIERAVGAVVESLRGQSRPLEGRADIARIATVSAQGDEAVGELIAQAIDRVGRHGVITVEEGRGLDTTLEVVEGLRFDRGYLSPYFVTEPDTMEVTFENSLILLAEQKFSAAQDLLPALEHAARAGRPLLVVADDVEGEALAMMVVNRLRSTVQSVAVKAPATGDWRRDQLDDLAVLTGATLFTRELGRSIGKIEPADFGRAKRVRVDREATTLLEGGGRAPDIRARIARVGRELEESDSDHERERLRERLGKLSSGVAVIRVGAPTAVALGERKARVEDALAATRAAVEEGVVPGGGVALLRAQESARALDVGGDEAVGRDIVVAALESPARQIAQNAGFDGAVVVERIRRESGSVGFNAWSCVYEDLAAAGILDPAKVTRVALQNASSIGALVLTTDAIVVDSDEEEEGEAPPEA
jgi:chaperonin GroEL